MSSLSDRVQQIIKNKLEQSSLYNMNNTNILQLQLQQHQDQHKINNNNNKNNKQVKQCLLLCQQKLLKLFLKVQECKNKSKNKYPIQIRDRIFLGNYFYSSDQQFIKQNKISLIISCLNILPTKMYQNIINYEKINIKDQQGQDLLYYQHKVYDIIERHLTQQNSGNIFIHCFKGISRSVAVLIMYLMKKQHKSYQTLFKQIKHKYPHAHINKWFIECLYKYQKQLLSQQQQISIDNIDNEQNDLLGLNNKTQNKQNKNNISDINSFNIYEQLIEINKKQQQTNQIQQIDLL